MVSCSGFFGVERKNWELKTDKTTQPFYCFPNKKTTAGNLFGIGGLEFMTQAEFVIDQWNFSKTSFNSFRKPYFQSYFFLIKRFTQTTSAAMNPKPT
ncbi:MAG: hypothetical protein LBF88_11360 [Planctomycetaceae bacterium]|jgi:hypothetical protein|nr:hypothetical protein [Planctomycetaceae bacterium]